MLNYEFVRVETMRSSGQLANMLEESKRGVPMGVHVYLKNGTNAVRSAGPSWLLVDGG